MITGKEQILALIQEFGGTQQAFAEFLGVKQSAVANWLKRGSLSSSAKELILSKCDYISERWLFLGEGKMYLSGTNLLYKEIEVSAGRIEFAEAKATAQRILIPGVNAEAFFPVKGFSMMPTIQEGDIVGVRQVYDLDMIKESNIYLIITADNERMLKHIKMGNAKSPYITLTSDNKAYQPFQIRKDSVLSIYKVIFHGRIPID